jgi:hypothetical protein
MYRIVLPDKLDAILFAKEKTRCFNANRAPFVNGNNILHFRHG